MPTITLTETIGADTMEVRAAGLPTGAGGIALQFTLHDGPMAFTLTDEEAHWLIIEIERRLAAVEVGGRS